jgi:hypothetical protein
MTMTPVRPRLRARTALVGSFVAIGTLAFGAAWACVPQARLVTIDPSSSGPSGSIVTVEGLAFDPGPAEVRWNASDGPRLATASGPDFSVSVTIPTTETGLYSIVVLSRAPDGSVGNAGSAAFQVTRPGDAQGAIPSAAAAPNPGRAGSSSLPGVVLAVGGVVLLVLGGLVGAYLSRRHRSPG